MSQPRESELRPANDGYEEFYSEKLWSWIPEIYRTLDGEAAHPGVLRALIEVVAREAATVRRDIDRLQDDRSVELADEWALAYLGALVGAKPVSEFNRRGNRVATGREIFYQRRKGTPGLLQELIRDIADREGVVVEAFRRLVRFPHRLDIDSVTRGRVTGSPTGGFVDLRSARNAGLTNGPFDEAAHFHDVRRERGGLGRYGIRKVNFHLFGLRTWPISLPTPHEIGPGRWTLDPSGREVTLFQKGQTSERPPDAIRETDLPDAISCRRFNASRHRVLPESLAPLDDPALDADLAPVVGLAFRDGSSFIKEITARLTSGLVGNPTPALLAFLLDTTLIPGSPKEVLWIDSLAIITDSESSEDPLPPSAVLAADLSTWGIGSSFADWIAIVFDPRTGRIVDGPNRNVDPRFVSRLHLGGFDEVGAGTYSRAGGLSSQIDSSLPAGPTGSGGGFTDPGPEGIVLPDPLDGTHRFTTSKTYEPALPPTRVFSGIVNTRLEADDEARPYVRFRPPGGSLDLTLRAQGSGSELTIDGLWIGLLAETLAPEIVADAQAKATPISARIVLDGNFERVTLRHTTLDPGGEMARSTLTQALAIPFVILEIEGQVESLCIDRSITGPIHETNRATAVCNAGRIEIRDSIVHSLDPNTPAILTRLGNVHLERSTIFGNLEVARLFSTDSFIDGRIRVTDNQNGCFRYSATGAYETLPLPERARLPARFESLVVRGAIPPHWVHSRRFGEAWYGVLSGTAPELLHRGASNGSEMGVYNRRGSSVLLDDLAAKVRSFLPVGQQPQYLRESDKEGTS